MEGLLKEVPEQKSILLFQMVPGKAMATDVVKLRTAKTDQGEEVKIDTARWHLHRHIKLNDANIIQAAIVAVTGSATRLTKY